MKHPSLNAQRNWEKRLAKYGMVKEYHRKKWRVGSPDLLHIDTFSKNNNSYSRA
jgi:hypothetical protein